VAENRKLAAIQAADVVAYSRVAGLTRAHCGTAPRSGLVDPTIAVHHGSDT
jgi:hypothetical protein